MHKNKFISIFMTILLIALMFFDVPIEKIKAENPQEVKLFSYFASESGGNHSMDTKVDDDQTFTLFSNLVHADGYMLFTLKPPLYSALKFGSTSVNVEIWLSANQKATDVTNIADFIIGNNITGSGQQTKDVETEPTKFSITFQISKNNTEPNENLQLRITTQYNGLPRTLYMHAGKTYPTGIVLSIQNPININTNISINNETKIVLVQSNITSPFGDYDIDKNSIKAEWSSDAKTISQTDTTWTWDFGKDDAKTGKYSITISAKDIQGRGITETKNFEIKNDIEKVIENYLFLIGILIFVLFVVGISLTIYLKKKKSIRKKR